MKEKFHTRNGVLLNGDSLDIIKSLEDKSIDLIFADYPFNCQDGKKDYIKFIDDIVKEFYRVLKENCILITINNPQNMWKTRRSYDKFYLRDALVLIRKGALRPAWHFGFQHNYLYVFIKGKNIRMKWNGTKKNHDKSFMTDVIYYQNAYRGKYGFHPQAIPLELAESMISIFTNEGDIILDPFAGSGTVPVVCEKLNRKWIGIEINPKYCEIAKRRIMDDINTSR